MSNSAFAIAFAEGVVAQVPDPTIGNAGLIVGVVSLIAGCFKAYLEYRQQMKRMDIQESKTESLAASLKQSQDEAKALQMSLAATSKELADSRERNHEFQGQTAGTLNAVQADVYEMRSQVTTNTGAIQQAVPTIKKLVAHSGILVAIPDPPPTLIFEAKPPCPDVPPK